MFLSTTLILTKLKVIAILSLMSLFKTSDPSGIITKAFTAFLIGDIRSHMFIGTVAS